MERLVAIPGMVPPAHDWPTGCRFNPRCRHAIDRCRSEPPPALPVPGGAGAMSRCLLTGQLDLEGVR